ncbi:potassium channel subfamily K member 17 [Megalops cyprinoides]|uniref:potassium channel subfamily K member 17 n=1 Tax=Megalops cyprinoides TaxID=118141 RepID=UPI001864FD41|nr:potassium channel subfamily K member 17 [Megalops cyprinoides]
MFSFLHGRLFRGCLPARLPSVLLLGAVYVVYVLTGGVIFWKLEGNLVQENIIILQEEKNRLLEKLPCLDKESLDSLAEVIQKVSKSGLSVRGNRTMDGFWKFTSSAVFAATVVTTIGYGNMSPSTMAGQIFCVFFALFGIPLNVVVLNRIGKYMLATERAICDFIERKTNHRSCTRVLVHTLSFVTGVLVFFVLPMHVFTMQEGWSYAQSIYYCFITLSTIGFGDYVADSNPDHSYPEWYGGMLGAWIFFGLAWLALLINHGIEILEKLNNRRKQKRKEQLDSSNDTSVQSMDKPAEQSGGNTELMDIQAPEK